MKRDGSAKGIVLHATAGSAALAYFLVEGKRHNLPEPRHQPHSPIMTMIMLWIGWFGFNGGVALAAGNGVGGIFGRLLGA